jgi:hypothetical protein
MGHATRTDVATRPRFGRGARQRTIRLREPPASGALRLPALHHHRGSPAATVDRRCASSAPAPPAEIGNWRPYGEREIIRFLIRNIHPLSSIDSYHIETPMRLNLRLRRLSDQ